MSKCKENCPKFKTMCGGQALIEGIMMRGPEKEAIVVRKPDGELEVKVEPLKLVKTRHPWMGWPLIRGPINFVDSMVHGVKALMYSAEFYPEDEEEESEKAKARREKREQKRREKAAKKGKALPENEEKDGSLSEKAMAAVVTVSVILGLGFSILLFFILPTLITGFLTRWIQSRLVLSLIEGAVRMVIFLGYIILTSKLKDMQRVYRYHGAEHQTIFCYEHGLPLTVENVRKMPRHHPRCGTSFLFVIMAVAILVHAVLGVGWDNTWLRLAVRLLSLPVIVAITYELNRFVGRHDNAFTRILTAPGLWLQNWTTSEPDDTMIEVGIRALSEVLPEEKGTDAW